MYLKYIRFPFRQQGICDTAKALKKSKVSVRSNTEFTHPPPKS